MVGTEKNIVFLSYRGRVTKVAPDCLRKASVDEQMSWDITTKEKTLFEHALDEENLSWEEPLLDGSGEFHDAEEPDIAAEPPNLEEEINAPVSERSVAENEDPNEEERRVEEPDIMAEGSRY